MTVTVRQGYAAVTAFEAVNHHEKALSGVREAFVPTLVHAAATATEYIGHWVAPHPCRIRAIYFMPLAAVTGANTNTTHLNVVNVGLAGAGTTAVTNLDLTSGNDLTANAKNVISEALTTSVLGGVVIALEAEKVGSGLDVPAGTMVILYDGGY